MKKLLCIAVAALMATSVVYAEETNDEPGNIGVGYQGFMVGGEFISSLAVRFAPDRFGGQVELGQVSMDVEGDTMDLIMLKGKGYYSLVQRQNSDFYVGASLGYLMIDMDGDEIDGFSVAPLMGVEYKFQGLPELGVNFEVSYEIISLEADGGPEMDLNGIGVCAGMAYYF